MIIAPVLVKSSTLEAMSAGAIDLCAKPYIQRRVVTVVDRCWLGADRILTKINTYQSNTWFSAGGLLL